VEGRGRIVTDEARKNMSEAQKRVWARMKAETVIEQ